MTAYANKSFSVSCSSGALTAEESRARWEAVFGPRPERRAELDPDTQTLHFIPCTCEECQTRCRKCGAATSSIRDGRVVLVTNGRCGPCSDLER